MIELIFIIPLAFLIFLISTAVDLNLPEEARLLNDNWRK